MDCPQKTNERAAGRSLTIHLLTIHIQPNISMSRDPRHLDGTPTHDGSAMTNLRPTVKQALEEAVEALRTILNVAQRSFHTLSMWPCQPKDLLAGHLRSRQTRLLQ